MLFCKQYVLLSRHYLAQIFARWNYLGHELLENSVVDAVHQGGLVGNFHWVLKDRDASFVDGG